MELRGLCLEDYHDRLDVGLARRRRVPAANPPDGAMLKPFSGIALNAYRCLPWWRCPGVCGYRAADGFAKRAETARAMRDLFATAIAGCRLLMAAWNATRALGIAGLLRGTEVRASFSP